MKKFPTPIASTTNVSLRKKAKKRKIYFWIGISFALCLVGSCVAIGFVKALDKNAFQKTSKFTSDIAFFQLKTFFKHPHFVNNYYGRDDTSTALSIDDKYYMTFPIGAPHYPNDANLNNFYRDSDIDKNKSDTNLLIGYCPYTVGVDTLKFYASTANNVFHPIVHIDSKYFTKHFSEQFINSTIVIKKKLQIKTFTKLAGWSFTIQVHLLSVILNIRSTAKDNMFLYGYWNQDVIVTTTLNVIGNKQSYQNGKPNKDDKNLNSTSIYPTDSASGKKIKNFAWQYSVITPNPK